MDRTKLDAAALIAELNRVKVAFQLRAIATVLGVPKSLNNAGSNNTEKLGAVRHGGEIGCG